ncbi:hypothetical protein ILYODFUR_020220 [Ilyodon furcidens]|uniref:Uncharacterized protein n=1 Tax=Ilyodon furcidens TaxID=33524 RepID=A0ABV0TK65_9TELE
MKPVLERFSLPFSTTTTSSVSAGVASSGATPQAEGSSPSNSWFTSPWMSERRRSPSLLETLNLLLMVVVAGETSRGSSSPGAGRRGRMKNSFKMPSGALL